MAVDVERARKRQRFRDMTFVDYYVNEELCPRLSPPLLLQFIAFVSSVMKPN